MRKMIRVTSAYQRRYENKGLLMWRERNKPVQVPAGSFVDIIEDYGDSCLCRYGDATLRIPKTNFASIRTKAPSRSVRRVEEEAAV